MAKSGARKTNRYSDKFKATAVRLSETPDVLIQDWKTPWTFTPSYCHAGANNRGHHGLMPVAPAAHDVPMTKPPPAGRRARRF
jgi:hypothetical protein